MGVQRLYELLRESNLPWIPKVFCAGGTTRELRDNVAAELGETNAGH